MTIKRPASTDPTAKNYSRRYDSDEQHAQARRSYLATKGRIAKREAAEHRQAIRDARTNVEQLRVLDSRPGESRRERIRLAQGVASW